MRLYSDTIRTINSRDYTPEQIEAWASSANDYPFWANRLSSNMTFVAELAGQIVGFTDFEPIGHIDCFYCHSQYQGQGVGSSLLRQIEQTARSLQVDRLFTEASITAQPFFQAKGFTVVRAQEVEYRGMTFCNFVMEKYLED